MDKITVAELATECAVQNQVVLSELKRLGLYVFSPTATIDVSFAETIRKKILSQREAEQTKLAEVERKKEAEAARKLKEAEAHKKTAEKDKKAQKKPSAVAVEEPPAEVHRKLSKKAAPKEAVEVKKEPETPKVSLAP